MDLTLAHNVTKQLDDGSFEIVHDVITVCEPCLIENQWGYTTYVDDVPADKCDVCK
jgi:hypothetical protein